VPSHINLNIIREDQTLVWKYTWNADQQGWTDWHPCGSQKWMFEPIAIKYKPEFMCNFGVSPDRVLYQNNWDLNITGDFAGWKPIGGKLNAPPAVATRKATIHIFHIGIDHKLYHVHWDSATGKYTPALGSFDKLDGAFLHTPTAVCAGPEEVTVFAVGMDSCLHYFHWSTGHGWSHRQTLEGHWEGAPKAVSASPGTWDVFGITRGGGLNHISFSNGKIHTLQAVKVPRPFQSVEALAFNTGDIGLVALDNKHTAAFGHLKNGAWQNWTDLGSPNNAPISFTPKLVSHQPGAISMMAVGTPKNVWLKYRDTNNGNWSQWVSLGGPVLYNIG